MGNTTKDILARSYSWVLTQEDDGRWSAHITEFPGCFSEGDTQAEACENLREAATNWVEAAVENGYPIPEPDPVHEASGRIALRLPRSLHTRVKGVASLDGVSINQWIVAALAHAVGTKTAAEQKPQPTYVFVTPEAQANLGHQKDPSPFKEQAWTSSSEKLVH